MDLGPADGIDRSQRDYRQMWMGEGRAGPRTYFGVSAQDYPSSHDDEQQNADLEYPQQVHELDRRLRDEGVQAGDKPSRYVAVRDLVR